MAKARVIITLKKTIMDAQGQTVEKACLLYTSPSPRD